MSKLIRLTILFFVLMVISGCSLTSSNPIEVKQDSSRDIAVINAQTIFNNAKLNGTDLSNGPCLSEHLQGDPAKPETVWVLDIAHNPREAIDDQPENQCSAFRQGQAKHFVEMDPEGNVIKIY